MKPLSREDLLNNQVGNPIAIDVGCCKSNRRFVRFERQVPILSGRDMEANPEQPSTLEHPCVQQYSSVGPLVMVKIGCHKSLTPGAMRKDPRSGRDQQCSA